MEQVSIGAYAGAETDLCADENHAEIVEFGRLAISDSETDGHQSGDGLSADMELQLRESPSANRQGCPENGRDSAIQRLPANETVTGRVKAKNKIAGFCWACQKRLVGVRKDWRRLFCNDFCNQRWVQERLDGMPEKKLNETTETVMEGEVINDREAEQPTSAMVAQRGIRTASDFAHFMGALMADVVEGRVTPDIAKAACAAGDKLLQVVKLQMEYGIEDKDGNRTLRLTGGK